MKIIKWLLMSILSVGLIVRYSGDGLFDFKWAFKKLPKSIPEALKKDGTFLSHILIDKFL